MSAQVRRFLSHATTALIVMASLCLAAPAAGQPAAQPVVRVRVTRAAAVMETPRGDSIVIGRVPAGLVVEYLRQSGRWIQVAPAPGTTGLTWRQGWIPQASLEFLDARPTAGAKPVVHHEMLIRGFGQVGTARFTASDSFDALLGSEFGAMYGGGGQIVLPSGLFFEASVDRFEKTGERLIVSADQIFSSGIANTVTVRPTLVSVGYRDPRAGRATAYFGAGAGWHVLEERSATTGTERSGHIGFQISGGAEFRVAPFIWLAGEIQWTSVPDALGSHGISAVFDEKDLGATTFRFKVLIGH